MKYKVKLVDSIGGDPFIGEIEAENEEEAKEIVFEMRIIQNAAEKAAQKIIGESRTVDELIYNMMKAMKPN